MSAASAPSSARARSGAAPAGGAAVRPQGARRGPLRVGLVLAVLGALAVAAGVTAATVFSVPSTATATADVGGARVAVTAPGLLEARDGTVTVRASGGDEVSLATARTPDLDAWLGGEPPVAAAVVGADGVPPEGALDVSGVQEASEEPAADPATSDLWLDSSAGPGSADLEVVRDAGPVQVIASSAQGGVDEVTLSWPSTAPHPLARPLLAAGIAALVVGLVLMAAWRRGSAGSREVAAVPAGRSGGAATTGGSRAGGSVTTDGSARTGDAASADGLDPVEEPAYLGDPAFTGYPAHPAPGAGSPDDGDATADDRPSDDRSSAGDGRPAGGPSSGDGPSVRGAPSGDGPAPDDDLGPAGPGPGTPGKHRPRGRRGSRRAERRVEAAEPARRPARRGAWALVPLAGALVVTGCSSSQPLPLQPQEAPAQPALSEAQLQRVVEGDGGVVPVVTDADADLDAERAGDRLGGAALDARRAAYAVAEAARSAEGGDPATAPSVRALGGERLLEAVPPAGRWPRTVITVSDPAATGPDGGDDESTGAAGATDADGAEDVADGTPVLTVLSQTDPRAPYLVLARANLLPGAVFPPLTQSDGAVQAVPLAATDGGGLVSPASQVVVDYADVLDRGLASDHYAGFAEDAFTATVLAEQEQQEADSGRFADFSVTHTPREGAVWALRTADGGGIAVAVVDATRTLAATTEGVTLNASPQVAALAGRPTGARQSITVAETVVFSIPTTPDGRVPGSGADSRELSIIGAERDVTAATLE